MARLPRILPESLIVQNGAQSMPTVFRLFPLVSSRTGCFQLVLATLALTASLACTDDDLDSSLAGYLDHHDRLVTLARTQSDSAEYPETCGDTVQMVEHGTPDNVNEFLLTELQARGFGCMVRVASTIVRQQDRLQSNHASDIVAWSPYDLSDSSPVQLLAVHYDSQAPEAGTPTGMWPAAAALEILDARGAQSESLAPLIVTMTDLAHQRLWRAPSPQPTDYPDTVEMRVASWATLPRVSPPMVLADAPGWSVSNYLPRSQLADHLFFSPIIQAQSVGALNGGPTDDTRFSDVGPVQMLFDGSALNEILRYHPASVVDHDSVAGQIALTADILAQAQLWSPGIGWIALTSALGFLLLAVFLSLRGKEEAALEERFTAVIEGSAAAQVNADDECSNAKAAREQAEANLETATASAPRAARQVEEAEDNKLRASQEHDRCRLRLEAAQVKLRNARSLANDAEKPPDNPEIPVGTRFRERLLSGLRSLLFFSARRDEKDGPREDERSRVHDPDERVAHQIQEARADLEESELEVQEATSGLEQANVMLNQASEAADNAEKALKATQDDIHNARDAITKADAIIWRQMELGASWKGLMETALAKKEASKPDIKDFKDPRKVIMSTVKEARGAADLVWGAGYFLLSVVVSAAFFHWVEVPWALSVVEIDNGSSSFLAFLVMVYIGLCALTSCAAISAIHVFRDVFGAHLRRKRNGEVPANRVYNECCLRPQSRGDDNATNNRLVTVSVGMFGIPILGCSLALALPDAAAYPISKYALLWLSIMVAGIWWLVAWKEELLEHEGWAVILEKCWKRKSGVTGRTKPVARAEVQRFALFLSYAAVTLSICAPMAVSVLDLWRDRWADSLVVGFMAASMVAVLFPASAVAIPLRMLRGGAQRHVVGKCDWPSVDND